MQGCATLPSMAPGASKTNADLQNLEHLTKSTKVFPSEQMSPFPRGTLTKAVGEDTSLGDQLEKESGIRAECTPNVDTALKECLSASLPPATSPREAASLKLSKHTMSAMRGEE